jgi:hypothetical protein
MHKLFSMYLLLYMTLYMFRARRAHHQERQFVSIRPLVTVILCWWPRCVQILPTCTPCKYIEKNLCITLVIYQGSLHISSLTFVLQSLPSSSRWLQDHNVLRTCNHTSTLPRSSLQQAVQHRLNITVSYYRTVSFMLVLQ